MLHKTKSTIIVLLCLINSTTAAWSEVRLNLKSTSQSTKKAPAKRSTTHPASSNTAKKTNVKFKKTSSKSKRTPKKRGQQAIDAQRTSEIQNALVKAGYIKGEQVTGKMDDRTREALIRLQAENGWQTKIVPDSRALIKLGLGPDHSAVINKDTAILSSVPKSKAEVPDK